MSDFEEFKQAEKSGWEAQGGRYHLGVENFTTIATPVLLEMAQVGKGHKLAIKNIRATVSNKGTQKISSMRIILLMLWCALSVFYISHTQKKLWENFSVS